MLDRLATRWRGLGGVELPAAPSLGDVALEAVGVSVTRGGREVVSGVDMVVRHGELIALVGPNGAGKSTLLGAMAGDLDASSGSVRLDGRPVHGWTVHELAVRRSVLLQRIEISFPFSVLDVVRMGRAPWAGTTGEEDDEQAVAGALADTDVADLGEREYTSLSGGERARAALARVLAQATGILLLDEPTAALDLQHQELVMGVARERARRGTAVVVVAHDLALAAAWADRIVVLEGGRLVADGSPRDVLTEELLSRVYRTPVEVFPHPTTGAPIILPRRGGGV
ncbi:MAG: heme ABC transporter ATP-binding protein [Candidatus Limnocylindrales bacterium]